MTDNKIEIKKDVTTGEYAKVFCNKCKKTVNHVVLASCEIIDTYVEYDGYNIEPSCWSQATDVAEIIQCKGCNEISFRKRHYFSEWNPGEFSEEIFPLRIESMMSIKDIPNLPGKIANLYDETINCFNNNLFVLCAAGIRSLVEGICLDKKIKDGEVEYIDKKTKLKKTKRNSKLQGKIQGLAEQGIITKKQADLLHEHRLLGNEALHELSTPSKQELSLAINIIEHILTAIYEIPNKGASLKESRAKRKSK